MKGSQRFPAVVGSVLKARRFVSGQLSHLSAETAESITLMVSELATNSIMHAQSDFTVSVSTSTSSVRVEVTDAAPGEPVERSATPTQTSGRGLRIVSQLSSDWGVRPRRDGGKTVWFSIDAE